MKKIILFLVFISLLGCEKDDICDETQSVTPRVIIEFYDASQPSILKNVTNLEVHTENEIDTTVVFTGVSKIKLPLNPILQTTTYTLKLNSTIVASANTDVLTFNYATKQLYVSRACGFKNVYELNTSNGIIRTDGTTNDGFWIQDFDVITNKINNEDEVHIKIYF